LADGLRFHFAKRPWVLYLTAVKSCAGKTAVFFDPLLLHGKEGAFRWEQVFQSLPAKARLRTRALVVDNLNGMKKTAKRNGWVLQLCHFHLIRKLQVQWKRPRRALKGGPVREELYQLIREALETPDERRLRHIVARLTQLAAMDSITLRLQAILRDFLKSVAYYRSYRAHPKLHLPATTNAVESMACIIRDLLRRTRCASNPKALLRWATALIRLRPIVTCNGKVINRIN
jgi:DNA primase large subunit